MCLNVSVYRLKVSVCFTQHLRRNQSRLNLPMVSHFGVMACSVVSHRGVVACSQDTVVSQWGVVACSVVSHRGVVACSVVSHWGVVACSPDTVARPGMGTVVGRLGRVSRGDHRSNKP